MRILISLLFIIVEMSTATYAQTACEALLTKGLREYDIQFDSSAYLNSTYDNYCSASGESKSGSLNVGLEAVVKAIPVKFTLGSADAKTAMNNFCKTYRSDTSSSSTSSRYRETIVQRAYQSFDNCIALSQAGNLVTHEVLTLEKVQIFLRAGIDKPVVVRGIDTSGGIKCTGASGGKLITYEQNTEVRTDNSMTINCTRTPREASEGQMIYEEGSIALDIALGKYAIFLPRDSKLAEPQASVINTTISELRGAIDRVEKRTLSCARAEMQSGVGRNVSIEASVPPDQLAGTVITGGGCEIPGFYGHYPPVTISKPTATGWTCTANDPPNLPLNLAVKAHVIYCKK